MKVMILVLFFIPALFCAEEPVLVDYNEVHKEEVITIAQKNVAQLFVDSTTVTQDTRTRNYFKESIKKMMTKCLDNQSKIKKVIVNADIVVGFIVFYYEKEQSLESMLQHFASKGIAYSKENILSSMPEIKKRDSECAMLAKIEGLAVAEDYRRRGYAKALLRNAEETIKGEWPTITRIELDVNNENDAAKNLYESEGFMRSSIQPFHLVPVDGIRYEKQLQQPSYHEEIP